MERERKREIYIEKKKVKINRERHTDAVPRYLQERYEKTDGSRKADRRRRERGRQGIDLYRERSTIG